MKRNVVKCSIEVKASGCIGCGTEFARDWLHDREIKIQIGDSKPGFISLPICIDCAAKRPDRKEKWPLRFGGHA